MHLVSLGCVRNLVDSEVMLGMLAKAGWSTTQDPEKADIIIVNTCSFIESAINESIDTILELAKLKQISNCKKLIVTGCLPERFREEIVSALPEVDFFLGTGAFDEIVHVAAGGLTDISRCLLPDPNLASLQLRNVPKILSSPYIAYLKVAEGCDKGCTYCVIPKLRGRYRSRSFEDIIAEARSLILSGVKELILVAQDSTCYGKDLSSYVDLCVLIKSIANISQNVWVRILYGHPESITESFIKTVAIHGNICSYFDIPIQHASRSVLKKMGRKYSHDDLRRLIAKIRSLDPDAVIRTTVIVGFPGETDKEFQQLLEFIREIRFDHLGAFIYSDSKDLPSHKFSGHVSQSAAKKRYDLLMSNQAKISLENNRKRIGKVVKILVEKKEKNNIFSGRSAFQAPEIDGVIYINSDKLQAGCFAHVKITDALEYDLIGKAV
ncbi:MAG: 30S ribosomal protein S12 methylthiotransferase RimO [Desulfobacterales bacterium]|nr:30S ribosomal protein S12 methylthiotransferase RimO [Desulfobacterales bacterium]